MRRLMNCDQVFEVLTRGPFPTGEAGDAAVEAHLRACHECRQLAEALQPAVELLHESLSPDQSLDLPEYQGLLAATVSSIATDERPRPSARPRVRKLARQQSHPPRRDYSQLLGAVRLIAATVLISAVGTLVWALATTGPEDAQPSLPLVQSPARPPIRIDSQSLLTLAALRLPAQCLPDDVAQTAGGDPIPPALLAAIREHIECCTRCHRAGDPKAPSSRAIAVMSKNCQTCHSL